MNALKELLFPLTPEKIAALTALVAVVIGPIISIVVAKWQIRATVVSSNRQNWINDLRERICEFITLANSVIVARSSEAKDDSTLISDMDRICRLQATIELMLNPDEEPHKSLVRKMTEIMASLDSTDFTKAIDQINSDTDKIVEMTKPILKSEWKRVKKGK